MFMINRGKVRHGAILKPKLYKCPRKAETGQHAFATNAYGKTQCIVCGFVKLNNGGKQQWPTPAKQA